MKLLVVSLLGSAALAEWYQCKGKCRASGGDAEIEMIYHSGYGSGHMDSGYGSGHMDSGYGSGHMDSGYGSGHMDSGYGSGHNDSGYGSGHGVYGLNMVAGSGFGSLGMVECKQLCDQVEACVGIEWTEGDCELHAKIDYYESYEDDDDVCITTNPHLARGQDSGYGDYVGSAYKEEACTSLKGVAGFEDVKHTEGSDSDDSAAAGSEDPAAAGSADSDEDGSSTAAAFSTFAALVAAMVAAVF